MSDDCVIPTIVDPGPRNFQCLCDDCERDRRAAAAILLGQPTPAPVTGWIT